MTCNCRKVNSQNLAQKKGEREEDLVEIARSILRTTSDPVSAVIKFLQERPEGNSLTGYVMHRVLTETFGSREKIPGLVSLLAAHVHEIIRQANVISIVNEHPAIEKWGDYIIKQTERIKFEVTRERDLLVLKNIAGIFAVEHGIAVPVESITVKPPKLLVTVNLGLIHPNRIVDI